MLGAADCASPSRVAAITPCLLRVSAPNPAHVPSTPRPVRPRPIHTRSSRTYRRVASAASCAFQYDSRHYIMASWHLLDILGHIMALEFFRSIEFLSQEYGPILSGMTRAKSALNFLRTGVGTKMCWGAPAQTLGTMMLHLKTRASCGDKQIRGWQIWTRVPSLDP